MFLLKKCEKCSKILHTTKPPFPLSVRLVRFWATYSEKVTPENAGTTGQVLTKTATGASWQDAPLGLLPQVLVTTRAGASVTATLGSVTVGPVTADENGLAKLNLTDYGEWTLTATLGGKTDSDALEVTNVMQYSVELAFSPLPRGYTQLEYIESNGTQYIDTRLKLTGYTLEATVMQTVLNTNIMLMTSQSNAGYQFVGVNGQQWLLGAGRLNAGLGSMSVNTKYFVEASTIYTNPYLRVDGVAKGSPSGANTYPDLYLWIFILNENGNPSQDGSMRLYDVMRVWSDVNKTNLAAEYYPVRRNSDGVLGLYDTVSNTFFTNSGTGSFIAGPEI